MFAYRTYPQRQAAPGSPYCLTVRWYPASRLARRIMSRSSTTFLVERSSHHGLFGSLSSSVSIVALGVAAPRGRSFEVAPGITSSSQVRRVSSSSAAT